MAVLSTQLRCNRCGSRLPEHAVGACPNCHSNLTEVGVWSELLEWGNTRLMGRTRYIWRRGVLWWGGGMAVAIAFPFFVRGAAPLLDCTLLVAASLVAGYALGRSHWQSAEREYNAATRGRG